MLQRSKLSNLLGISILLAAIASPVLGRPSLVQVSSPNKQILLRFDIVPAAGGKPGSGQLVYSVSFHGKPVIEKSTLSLQLIGEPPLGASVHISGATSGLGVDDYSLIAGKTSRVHDRYRVTTIHLAEGGGSGRKFAIQARVYNGAVAFRYQIPKQGALKQYQLKQENTEFHFSDDATAWALRLPNYRSMYEGQYVRQTINELSNEGSVPSHILIGAPMLLHLPGVAWVAICEADLEGNSAMYLEAAPGSWQHMLMTKVSPPISGVGPAVDASLPHHSAWRVLQIGNEPGDLIKSNVVTDLNPPSRLANTSWIHPGKASWNWWSGNLDQEGKPAYITKTMKYYVDFAADSGFSYMLIDGGWSPPNDITKLNGKVNVPEIIKYAEKRGVRVWIWVSAKNVAAQMRTAFPLYEKWGVAGVKIDFVERNDQKGIQFYYAAAKLAAKYHLMLDFHGSTTPWGLERTYPNVMSYEAVAGLEQNHVSRRDNLINRTTFPFTRMLSGPLDYTPGGFDNVTRDDFVARSVRPMVMGTRAQQLALYVVFRAPFEMVSDAPSAYANQPSFQFIRDVPVTWDATRVLNGFPGKFVTIARRHGDDWYLGSITNWSPRKLDIPLKFLGSGTYTAQIYEDAPDASKHPKHVVIRSEVVDNTDTLTLSLAQGGGCAIRFVPTEKID